MPARTPITVAYGDGIGPEIMRAVLEILDAAGAGLEPETIEIGERVYLRGHSAGIEPQSWESLLRSRVFLKAPVTVPRGTGFQNFNVVTRKTLGQYANVRPCVSYHPFIETLHPEMDVVIVRENEEDLYTGIEYQLTPEVNSSLKLISRPGSRRIVRYAFEYARRHNRKKVTCFVKDNIMKMTDGLFHRCFDEIAAEYPDISREAHMMDTGAALLADSPAAFDVIVVPNLYGDILSEVAAQIAGSVGLAGSANIGDQCATFEAVHGSAPRRAGQNLANPSGLLMGAVLMLVHICRPEVAARVHNAWLRTLEDGIHTYDIFDQDVSVEKAGTREFAAAVAARLGRQPNRLPPVSYADLPPASPVAPPVPAAAARSELRGIDVFVCWPSRSPGELAAALAPLVQDGLDLQIIDNLGVKVWPTGPVAQTFCTDSFRCRFLSGAEAPMSRCIELLQRIAGAGIEIALTQSLHHFNGQAGYSPAQG